MARKEGTLYTLFVDGKAVKTFTRKPGKKYREMTRLAGIEIIPPPPPFNS